MRKYKFEVIIIFLFLFLLVMPHIYASIEGNLYKVQDNPSEDVVTSNFQDANAKFYFSTDDTFETNIDSQGKYVFDTSKIYCWDGCNIFPKIYLKGISIYENNEFITDINVPYSNEMPEEKQQLGLFTNIFTSGKVDNDGLFIDTPKIDNSNILSFNPENDTSGLVYSVTWSGVIVIPEDAKYTFFASVSGELKVLIDNESVFETEQPPQGNNLEFSKELLQGNHSIQLQYYTSEDYQKPNLYWSSDSFERGLVSNENLIFVSGGSKKITREKNMKMTTTANAAVMSSTYPQGTWYYYNTMNTNKRPILFVHGWSNEEVTSGGWGNVPQDLESFGHECLELVYNPANLDNKKNAGMLYTIMNNIRSTYSSWNNIDIVSHSMGGSVVRGYIQNMGVSSSGYQRNYQNDIRKYVIIASPMHGSLLANLVNDDFDFGDCPNIDKYNQKSEATQNMEMGSDFIWELNNQIPNIAIDYLTLAGIEDYRSWSWFTCFYDYNDITDGLVNYRSASLLKYNIPLVLLKYPHSTAKVLGIGPTGINTCEKTKDIISEFISRSPGKDRTLAIKSLLDNANGEFYIDPDDTWANMRIPLDGDLLIQFVNINPTRVVLQKNSNNYELTKNPRTSRWFYLNFQDKNHFKTAIPPDTYTILYDKGNGLINYGATIQVIGDTTTLKLIADTDGDGWLDDNDDCPAMAGQCTGCPPPPNCAPCAVGACTPTGLPTCSPLSSTTQCGSDYYEYGCPWGNNLSNDTGIKYHDYHCDGAGSCVDYPQSWQVDENCNLFEYCYWDGSGSQGEDYYCKCQSKWVLNDTWFVCNITDYQYKNYYDANNCSGNPTPPVSINQSCDYCTPAWTAINTTCQINDKKTEWYNDTNNCYAKTNLSSDLTGKPTNKTYDCDYCIPSPAEHNTTCTFADTLTTYYTDANNCYIITGLDSDRLPSNKTQSCNYCTSTWQNINSTC